MRLNNNNLPLRLPCPRPCLSHGPLPSLLEPAKLEAPALDLPHPHSASLSDSAKACDPTEYCCIVKPKFKEFHLEVFYQFDRVVHVPDFHFVRPLWRHFFHHPLSIRFQLLHQLLRLSFKEMHKYI